jgi:CMP-N-acetylneuraminic acid synthetase
MVKDLKKVCFVSQARLGSKRFPSKMIRPFANSNLVEILCQKVKTSSYIPKEQFFFSAYEQDIIEIVERCGLNVFRRSKRSAESEGPIEEILEWHQLPYDFAIQISACNPLLAVSTIDAFARAYVESAFDGMFAVVEKRNFFWNSAGELLTPWPGSNFMDTKAVEVTYEAAHCMYAGRMDFLRRGTWMGTVPFKKNAPALFPIPELEAFDIDYPWQFPVAEALYARGMARESPRNAAIVSPSRVSQN